MSDWSYYKCSSCPRSVPWIRPQGPTNARVMILGDIPNRNEDRTGRPFSGNAGKELAHTYLPLAGLKRNEVFMSYVVQCRCDSDNHSNRYHHDW